METNPRTPEQVRPMAIPTISVVTRLGEFGVRWIPTPPHPRLFSQKSLFSDGAQVLRPYKGCIPPLWVTINNPLQAH